MAEQIAQLFAKISADVSNFESGMKKVDAQLSGLQRGSEGLRNTIGAGLKAAAAIGVVAVGGLGVALGSAIGEAVSLEQAAANISAVFGAMAPPVEDVQKLINELALDPKLLIDTEGAAAGIEMLAKNGVAWNDIAGGMARSSVLLSNATGADLATAVDIATNAMGIFGLGVGSADSVIATFTAAANKSQFGVEDWGYALSNAGPKAAAFGFNLDELFAAMTMTSSGFSSGMQMGTSWAWMINGLVPNTDKAAAAMQELGLITADGSNAFFNADGTGKNLTEVITLLQGAFNGLSTEQQMSYSRTIFGQEAFGALSGVLGMNNDELAKLIPQMSDMNAVEDGAATRTGTLAAQWENFHGKVENLKTQIGQHFLPLATDLLTWVSDMASTHGPAIVTWAENFAGILETLVGWLGDSAEEGTIFNDKFKELPKPIQDTVIAINNVITAISSFITKAQEILKPITDWITENVELNDVIAGIGAVLLIAFGPPVIAAITGFLTAIAPLAAVFVGVTAASAAFRLAWETDWGGVRTKTEGVIGYLTGAFAPLKTAIETFGGEALQEIVDWATGNETEFNATKAIWEAAQTSFGTVFADMGTKLAEWGGIAWTWFEEKFPTAAGTLKEAIGGIQEKFDKFWDVVKPLIDKAVELFNDFVTDWKTGSDDIGGALEKAKIVLDGVWSIMITAISTSVETMLGLLTAFVQFLSGDYAGAWQTMKDTVQGIIEGLDDIVETVLVTIGGLFGTNKTDIETWYNDTKKWIGEWWTHFSTQLANRDWGGIYQDMLDFFDTSGIKTWYDDTTEKVSDWWENFKTYIVDKDWFQYGVDVIQGFWNGMKSLWEGFSTWTQGVWSSVVSTAKNILGIASPSTVFESIGKDIVMGMQNGINNNASLATTAISNLGTRMRDDFAGLVDDIPGRVRDSVDGTVAAINSASPTLTNYFAALQAAKIAALELASQPVVPSWYKPGASPVVTPGGSGNSGGSTGSGSPTTPNAPSYGAKNISNALFALSASDTMADIVAFAEAAKTALMGPGQPQLQGSSAEYYALQSLLGAGLGSVSVDKLLASIQTLIQVLQRQGFGNQFNLAVAPNAAESQQIELQQLIDFLNGLYQ